MMEIGVFRARSPQYFISYLLPCSGSIKTNFSVVIWIKFSFSSTNSKSLPILVLKLHLLEKLIRNRESILKIRPDEPLWRRRYTKDIHRLGMCCLDAGWNPLLLPWYTLYQGDQNTILCVFLSRTLSS